jgi:UDP-N-acetylmuramate dehydrogenase
LEFSSVNEAQDVLPTLRGEDAPLMLLGGGSNLLLTKDFSGTVIHSAIMGTEAHETGDGHVLLRCGSGERWDDIVDLCVSRGWYGAENLSLIPGDVGASAVQNIGAYGVEAKDLIVRVEAVEIATGNLHLFTNEECRYSYRQSRFKQDWRDHFFITHVTYCLSLTFKPHLDYGNIRMELEDKGISNPTAAELRQTIIDIRNAKLPDPKMEGNAGSFFMNPVVSRKKYERLSEDYPNMPHYTIDEDHEKIPAGWMIEQCGWKGKTLGRAGVHHRQALVLVNKGDATGEEIVHLCEQIRMDVYNRFGIEIHPEVNII